MSWTATNNEDSELDPEGHDWYSFQELKLGKQHGGPFISVKLNKDNIVDYICELCNSTTNTCQILDTHCKGAKHIKKKNKWDKSRNIASGTISTAEEIKRKPFKRARTRPRSPKEEVPLPPPICLAESYIQATMEANQRPGGFGEATTDTEEGSKEPDTNGFDSPQLEANNSPSTSSEAPPAIPLSTLEDLFQTMTKSRLCSHADAHLVLDMLSILLEQLKKYYWETKDIRILETLVEVEMLQKTTKALHTVDAV